MSKSLLIAALTLLVTTALYLRHAEAPALTPSQALYWVPGQATPSGTWVPGHWARPRAPT